MQQIVFLLQNLLFVQHVSGTIMPIIKISRVIQMAAAVVLGFLVYRSLVDYCRAVSRKLDTYSTAPHQTNDLVMMGIMVPETC